MLRDQQPTLAQFALVLADLPVRVRLCALQVRTTLRNIFRFRLHLADKQARHRKLLLDLASCPAGARVAACRRCGHCCCCCGRAHNIRHTCRKLHVGSGIGAERLSNLAQVAQQIAQHFVDSLLLVGGHVTQLLQFGGRCRKSGLLLLQLLGGSLDVLVLRFDLVALLVVVDSELFKGLQHFFHLLFGAFVFLLNASHFHLFEENRRNNRYIGDT